VTTGAHLRHFSVAWQIASAIAPPSTLGGHGSRMASPGQHAMRHSISGISMSKPGGPANLAWSWSAGIVHHQPPCHAYAVQCCTPSGRQHLASRATLMHVVPESPGLEPGTDAAPPARTAARLCSCTRSAAQGMLVLPAAKRACSVSQRRTRNCCALLVRALRRNCRRPAPLTSDVS
jgi:hypothetical protein